MRPTHAAPRSPRTPRRRALLLLAALVASLLPVVAGPSVVPAHAVKPPARAKSAKVTICHRTRSTTNPYRRITVAPAAVRGTSGHPGHEGSVYPGVDGRWGDIIPNSPPGVNPSWPGLNYVGNTTGQSLWSGATAGCSAMTAKQFYDVQKAAGQSDVAIAADLQEQAANEDAALLAALGGTFTADNMSRLDLLGVTTLGTTGSGTSVTLYGSARLGSSSADLGFEYGTDPALVGATAVAADVGTGDKSFNEALTGLNAGATYYYRATATTQPGTDFEGVMTGAIRSFGTGTTTQTITFPAPSTGRAGEVRTLSGTSTSQLPVTFASTTPAVCAVDGVTLTYKALGSCTVTADQGGNATYRAAPQVAHTVSVTRGSQSITLSSPGPQTLSSLSVYVPATASSGLVTTLRSTTTGTCTVSGKTVTFVTTGACELEADQAGDASWAPAATASTSFVISKTAQTISVPTVASRDAGTTYVVPVTATSGLAVTLHLEDPASTTCTPSDRTVTFHTPGSCVLVARQPGNSVYEIAPEAELVITVVGQRSTQTITFEPAASVQRVQREMQLTARTTAEGLVVSFSSGSTGVCTVSGTTVTLLKTGECLLVADQSGNDTYAPAASVPATVQVTTAPRTVSLPTQASGVVGSTRQVLATAQPALGTTLTSTTTDTCTVSDVTVLLKAVGTCALRADGVTHADYAPAHGTVTFQVVAKQAQTVSISAGSTALTTQDGLPVSASTTAAGLEPDLQVVPPAQGQPEVCAFTQAGLQLLRAGDCVLEATQAGDAHYLPATAVRHTIAVSRAPHTLDFPQPEDVRLSTGTVVLSATSTPGSLGTTFSSTTPDRCTVSGATVTLLSRGTCTLTASSAGDDTHVDAAPVTRSFRITIPPAPVVTPSPTPTASETPSPSASPTGTPAATPVPSTSAAPSPTPVPPAAPAVPVPATAAPALTTPPAAPARPAPVPTTPPAVSPTTVPTRNATPSPTAAPKPSPVGVDAPRAGLVTVPAVLPRDGGVKKPTVHTTRSGQGLVAPVVSTLDDGDRLRPGQAATLPGRFLFEFDKDRLTPRGVQTVKELVPHLVGNKAVHCEGYTDYAGDKAHELDLSKRRSLVVCKALRSYGAKVTYTTKGYGGSKPVVLGGKARERHENRRVVVVVTK